MKQNDIILIIVVVFIAGISSFFVSNALFTSSEKRKADVEVVEPITQAFAEPDTRYFNEKAVNPTQLIQIGNQDNKQPF
jgi:hypothetical protein